MRRHQPVLTKMLQSACAALLALSMWFSSQGTYLPVAQATSHDITSQEALDQDSNNLPDPIAAKATAGLSTGSACAQAYTPISSIQGKGSSAAITGTVTTQGIVVGDFEGPYPALHGFYLEDPIGDDNPATSEGIFIYNGNNDSVHLGEQVQVTGSAGDYQGQTQVSAASIKLCATGQTVLPVEVTLPIPDPTYLERYEGMLIHFTQKLYVTDTYQLGRFGEVLLASGGRLVQPTHAVPPGASAVTWQAQNNLNQILLDDASQAEDPDPIMFGHNRQTLSATNTLRGGDTVEGITGVLTYTWGGNSSSPNAFRIRTINALGGGVPFFQPENPRPATPMDPGGYLRVVSMNLLNYFNTFTGCTNGLNGIPTDCRGAENQVEFDRQSAKTVAAILATGGDIIGITEMENDGYGSNSAIQDLVNRLNAASVPGTFAFINADAGTGQVNALGFDAIKVGLLYRPGKMTPVATTAVLNTPEFVNGGDSEPRNRPALAQAFQENASGKIFVVSVNHFKSKGSACDNPDANDGQGNCAIVRTQAAQRLATWLTTNPTGSLDARTLILGDLNSYAQEDPITTLQEAGYASLVDQFQANKGYSYTFNGQWGYLDYALADVLMLQDITGIVEFPINADEPPVLDYNTNYKSSAQVTNLYSPDAYRAADHDPVIVGIDLSDNHAPRATRSLPDRKAYIAVPFSFALPADLFHDPDLGDHLTLSAGLAGGEPLPAWLTFDPATATFSGFPDQQALGNVVINVTATDTSHVSASISFAVAVQTRLMLPMIQAH